VNEFRSTQLFKHNYTIPNGIDLTVNRGGTSSGKTYNIIQVLFVKAWERPKTIITVVGQDIPNLKKGAIRDAQNIISENKIIRSLVESYNKTDRIFTLKNGSIIEFNSYDDEQDAKNGKRDYSFFNEVNGIIYEIFEAIYVRTKIHTWVDFNPSSDFWLKEKKIEQRDNVRTIKSTFRHNPFLDEKTISKIKSYEPTKRNIEQGTADEYRWKVYGEGEYAPREGVVFKNWRRGSFPNDIDFGFGIDWGVRDPFALIKVAIDKSKRRIYLKECKYQSNLGSSDILQAVMAHCRKKDLIVCDNAQLISINDLRDKDYNAIPAFKPKVSERIKWALEYELVVDESPNIENELNNYIWADKKSETPIDDFNHSIDAWMYYFVWWYMNVRPR